MGEREGCGVELIIRHSETYILAYMASLEEAIRL